MMSVISIILILIIAIAEGVCFFSLWLDIGMDNEFLPYIVALICLVLFLVTPYLVSGGFMRLALLKNQRLRLAIEFVAALFALSTLLTCWYAFSKSAVAVFQNSDTVSDGYDIMLRVPFICTAIEILVLPPLFLKKNESDNKAETHTDTMSLPDEEGINIAEKENADETL